MIDLDPTEAMLELVHDGVSQSAAIAWRWLRRERDPVPVTELSDAFYVSYPTAHNWVTLLEEHGVVETGRRVNNERGRNPLLASAQARCPECGEWFDGVQGVGTHHANAHGLNAADLKEMSPDDVGLNPAPPPAEGDTHE